MRHPLLVPDLRELIVEREEKALRDFFLPHHPAATAELVDDLEPAEALYVLKLFAGRTRAEVFSYLEAELQDGIAQLMERNDLAALVSAMSHDERADLITRLPEERTEQIMPLLAQAEREDIRRLTAYKEDTAGAVMTSDYATVPAELTAAGGDRPVAARGAGSRDDLLLLRARRSSPAGRLRVAQEPDPGPAASSRGRHHADRGHLVGRRRRPGSRRPAS